MLLCIPFFPTCLLLLFVVWVYCSFWYTIKPGTPKYEFTEHRTLAEQWNNGTLVEQLEYHAIAVQQNKSGKKRKNKTIPTNIQ